MANLLDSLQSYLSPDLLGQLSGSLGENQDSIKKAASGMGATILGGLINKSSDSAGFSKIFSLLSDSRNVSVLDNLGSLVNSGNLARNDPKDTSGQLMNLLFGNKVPGMIDGIASFAGIKSSSASSLLGVVGPMVMGVLGKNIMSGGLNASSLMTLLSSQRSGILDMIPGGLVSSLGLGSLSAAASAFSTPKPKAGANWLWPVLLGLGVLLAWFLWRGCNKPQLPEVNVNTDSIEAAMQDMTNQAVDAAADAATAAAGYVKQLGSGFELKGNMDGIESKLISFIESNAAIDKTTWFEFDRLTFATSSAEIDMEKSSDQLNNMNEIMKAFPGLRIKVGGYTDATGDEAANMKLSQARAEAVVNALVGMGVDKARLEAEGYGSQHPVADNETDEGRAQNRRIAVRVLQR